MNATLEADSAELEGEQRTLTLLHLLGEEAAELVLGRLDSSSTSTLRKRLKQFKDELPSPRKQRQVLDEFERFFAFAQASGPPKLRLHGDDEDDEDFGPAPARPQPKLYQPTGDALVDLERLNKHQLSNALALEQPRMVALLLKMVSAKRTAELLELLPDEHRKSVVQEMSRDPRASELIVRRIAASTVDRALEMPAEPPPDNDPIQRLVAVLRETPKPKRRQMIRALEAEDPDKAANINRSLYLFEDLLSLEDQQIQQILARVDSETLSTALFGADEAIVDKMMNNLSKRARAALQEEISFKRNVPGSQLKAAREKIVIAIAEADQEPE